VSFFHSLSARRGATLLTAGAATLLLVAGGCTEADGDDASAEDGGGSSVGGGGSSAGVDGDPGLLACELPLTCFIDSGGPYHSPDEAGMYCAAKLLAAGTKGAVLFEYKPGGGGCTKEHLYLLLGDGTAVRQSRAWTGCGQGLYQPTPFGDATPQEICQVQVTPELIAACETESSPSTSVSVSGTGSGAPGDDCRTLVEELLTGCSPVEAQTCESAAALIQ